MAITVPITITSLGLALEHSMDELIHADRILSGRQWKLLHAIERGAERDHM
jgi:hypothetical protein